MPSCSPWEGSHFIKIAELAKKVKMVLRETENKISNPWVARRPPSFEKFFRSRAFLGWRWHGILDWQESIGIIRLMECLVKAGGSWQMEGSKDAQEGALLPVVGHDLLGLGHPGPRAGGSGPPRFH
jgi:hypothetical protein